MFKFKNNQKKTKNANEIPENNENDTSKIPKSIDAVKKLITQEFSLCGDFVMREVILGAFNTRVIIAYLDGMIDKNLLSENIIEPIIQYAGPKTGSSVIKILTENIISFSDLKELNTFKDTIKSILFGNAVLYIDREGTALNISLTSIEKRAIGEPNTEISIKGSREGFTEDIRTNITLLRRRIKNSKFKIECINLGEETNTELAICYIQDIAKREIIDEVKKRINVIKTDAILGSGYIEEFIQDAPFSVFPIVGNSEKSDKVAAKLLEGRVAIIVDGTPNILTVPYLLIESIQAAEDYFGEFFFASLMRILRFTALLVSIYLPGLYVALTTFHQTIIPFKLMISVAAAREGIPFSSFVEAFLMVFVFEILREAGLRLPRAIGQAVSIVGAIVLGDAAVNAGIASAPVVIVSSLAGICSFLIPPLMKTSTIFRFLMLIAASIFGFLGIGSLTIVTIVYLCSKKSFGVPYLTPFSPLQISDLKDSLIVTPVWAMFGRPRSLTKGQNTKRKTYNSPPTRRKRND